MQKFVVTVFFIMLTVSSIPACAAEQPIPPKMTTSEALNALQEIIPDVKVLGVNATPIHGLFEVAVETKGQKGIIYLDSSRQYLISGSIVHIATKQNLTQERSAELNKVNVSEIPLDDALVMGSKDAKKKVIVFTDPD